MFTGIIEGFGILKRSLPHGEGKRLTIETTMDLTGTKIGDSIAVNGVCLTAVSLTKNTFEIDMAPETVSRSTFKSLTSGSRVNIERALRFSDRLDGHLVSGHVDGTGRITSKIKKSNAIIYSIEVAPHLASDMIEKGSVAIDGISLTINQCNDRGFQISVIPHTAHITTIGFKDVGDEVNIETDMIGKYVRKFLEKGVAAGGGHHPSGKGDISMELLAKKGFL